MAVTKGTVAGMVIVAFYLAAVTSVCVATLIQMWPHPTPTTVEPQQPPKAKAALLTPEYLVARCGPAKDSDCRRCEAEAHELRNHLGLGDRYNDPECVKIFWVDVVMWNERRLLLIVVLSGALGGLIASARSFFWFVGIGQFAVRWIPLYLFAPLTSGLLGAMIYLVIRGGFFSGLSTVSDTSPYTFAAVAALVGMFHRETAVKLREVFQIVFTKAESGAANPKPKLTNIDPKTPLPRTRDTKLTLTGESFIADSAVMLDTTPLDPKQVVRVNDTQLTATITPADLEDQDDSVVVSVFNPTPGGGASDGIRLQIEPKAEENQ